MPEYVYRAVTKNGIIVKNKVEEGSKQTLIKRLKDNDLMPIQIVQVGYIGKSRATKKVKKNVTNMEDIMKTANSTNIFRQETAGKISAIEKINLALSATEKITTRDLMIFTQNFYLLKKANFNNIHALNTIIQSTENLSFKGILEDILARSRSGRLHVYNNGILFKCIPIYLYKYD